MFLFDFQSNTAAKQMRVIVPCGLLSFQIASEFEGRRIIGKCQLKEIVKNNLLFTHQQIIALTHIQFGEAREDNADLFTHKLLNTY